MQNFIDDGYTETGYIAARDGMHGELRFTFRPMLSEEVDAVGSVLDQNNVARSHETIRGVLVKHLTSWSDERPINAASVRILKPALWNRLYLIVAGKQASDPDPKATPADRDEWLEDVLEAGRTGQTVGEARADADVKNSGAG